MLPLIKVSFIKEEQRGGYRGGYGWVIRDSSGHMLCSYLGPLDCINANGAKVSTMPMGAASYERLEKN